MMMDVDALSRRFGPLIALHCGIAYIVHGVDIGNRPDAYDRNTFAHQGKTKCKITSRDDKAVLPIITQSVINTVKTIPFTKTELIKFTTAPLTISS